MHAEPHAPTAPIHVEHAARLARLVADGRPHPVAALARACATSFDEVAALVLHLRSLGMRIACDDDHVLAAPFDPLDAQALRAALDRAGPPGPWTAAVVETTPSTNAALMRDLRQGAMSTPCVLTTDLQSDGRGRRGRSWRAVPGASLTVSFGLSSERDLVALEGITLACGLAARDALAAFGVDARLKWPNDVVVDDDKLAGILVESLRTDRTVLVVGIGINITPLPHDEAQTYRATDLASCGVASCDRHRLIAGLAAALANRIATVERAGFASLADEYNAVDAYLGRRVRLSQGDRAPTTGVERGVDGRGALCIETANGRLSIVAGDISLRLADA